MAKDLWINLPVKDIRKSKEFFIKIGFPLHSGPGNMDHSASFSLGDNRVIVMLFSQQMFESFTQDRIADTKQGTEVLFSLGAETREEVDEMANKAARAGGTIFAKPQEREGWMYGCGFADLDGHRWNVLYMDPSKMPNG
ncbi:MAG: extradiol dioxygenase [Dehalococcoidia bacterium]|nr:extradiol dioxygenase [Dehalococcoidia bacterium]